MATKSYSRTRTLVECALMIAVGTVLAQIKIFEMPFGGSVTLVSMLPFILVPSRREVGPGHGLRQQPFGRCRWAFTRLPPALSAVFVGVVLLDYVLAFTLLYVRWRDRLKALQKPSAGRSRGHRRCVRHPLFVQLFVRRASVGQLPGKLRMGEGDVRLAVQLYL